MGWSFSARFIITGLALRGLNCECGEELRDLRLIPFDTYCDAS